MPGKQRILIVDDDNNIAELISLYLNKECFETMIVGDGDAALNAVKSFNPNLILLDIMLPGMDGYQVCREVRTTSTTPIIMLSAKGEIFDKVLGLELGADDYMEKPFDSKELVARVKAVLRRYKPVSAPAPEEDNVEEVRFTDLVINKTNYSVEYMGSKLDMPPKELELLFFLLQLLIMFSQENSSSIRYGAMNTLVTHVLSMFISNVFVKRLMIMMNGKSLLFGE